VESRPGIEVARCPSSDDSSRGCFEAGQAGISRYGQPEEIAELLGFMVSPAATWMTGTSVRMDDGEIKGI
jgi:NAD(P)-dependent dehydrogenase (short-subunit alcohol dehydrogenase family)